MSLKHHIRLYACLAKDEPLAVAVYDVPEKTFSVKGGGLFPTGGTIFPIAVGVRLTDKIRINRVSGEVQWTPRRDIGGEPFPVLGGFAADDPKDNRWVRWAPEEMMLQSLHFMLSECAKHDLCGFRIDLNQDWTKAGMRADIRNVKPRPKKRTALKWLAAWRRPFWRDGKVPPDEQFSQIQALADAYGLERLNSMSHFENVMSEINRA